MATVHTLVAPATPVTLQPRRESSPGWARRPRHAVPSRGPSWRWAGGPAARAVTVACACVCSSTWIAAAAGEEDAAGLAGDEAADSWERLTTEESWQPGKVGEFSSSLPMKDLECKGPQTKILHQPDVKWAQVKEQLHQQLTEPLGNPWLFQVTMRIQKDEPDTCVLGITSTSVYLLPVTMPKFRNMARMLSQDQNLLILNLTFYDILRSDFPLFGILDGLATPEYKAWFGTPESLQFFPLRPTPASCGSTAATELREEISRSRDAHRAASGKVRARRPRLEAGAAAFTAGKASVAGPACAPAEAASLLVWALARASGFSEARRPKVGAAHGSGAAAPREAARQAALRDVIELVSRAEELIRDYSWSEGVAFGELVATPWNIWWLLHRLQLTLPPLVLPPPEQARTDQRSGRQEL